MTVAGRADKDIQLKIREGLPLGVSCQESVQGSGRADTPRVRRRQPLVQESLWAVTLLSLLVSIGVLHRARYIRRAAKSA